MTTTTLKDKERPKSSSAEILTMAATAYNGMQLKELVKGQHDLMQSSERISQSSLRQEVIQQSIDYGIRNIEQLQIQQNEVAIQQNKIGLDNLEVQERQFQHLQIESKRKMEREKIADAEKELEKQKQAEIQSYKDITYSIFREQQLILETSMTILEKFITLQKLHEIIMTVSSGVFTDTTDRTYRDATEDSINAKLKEIREQFSEQDETDLQTVIEIEAKDENAEAEELLENLKNREKNLSELKTLVTSINKKKGLTDSDYKNFTSAIQKFTKLFKEK